MAVRYWYLMGELRPEFAGRGRAQRNRRSAVRDSTKVYTPEQLQELLDQAEQLQEQIGYFRAAIAAKEQARGFLGMGPLTGFLYPVDILLTGFVVTCQSMLAEHSEAGRAVSRPAGRSAARQDA